MQTNISYTHTPAKDRNNWLKTILAAGNTSVIIIFASAVCITKPNIEAKAFESTSISDADAAVCVVGSQVEHRDGVLLPSLQSSSIFTSLVSDDNLIVSNVSASAGVLSVWSWAAPESFLNNKVICCSVRFVSYFQICDPGA